MPLQKWIEYCCVVTSDGAAFFFSNEQAFVDGAAPLAVINGLDVRRRQNTTRPSVILFLFCFLLLLCLGAPLT